MNVLLIGSGGREHALAWKMARSSLVGRIYALPGSDGIAMLEKTECISGDIIGQVLRIKPDLVVIGPEKPMAEGVADKIGELGIPVLGPSQAAAQLETSKIFSKEFMVTEGIPTAESVTCDCYDDALTAVRNWNVAQKGVVIKADGLAAGKGVVVTHSLEEAEETLYDFMKNPDCTVKTERILLEEKLAGKEVSAFALCDGKNFIPLGYACDYKRVNDGNEGPNTGGMGGYAPKGWPSDKARAFVNDSVFAPVLAGMARRGTPFRGILFAGLMVDGDDVKVIEFNVRFGDPEAQILLPLIEEDIVPLFMAAAKGNLSGARPPARPAGTAVHVVMVSRGYPDVQGQGMQLGEKILMPEGGMNDNALLFISGARKEAGVWKNAGGRVLGVTALGKTVEEARRQAYAEIEKITFNGAHWRRDIGV